MDDSHFSASIYEHPFLRKSLSVIFPSSIVWLIIVDRKVNE